MHNSVFNQFCVLAHLTHAMGTMLQGQLCVAPGQRAKYPEAQRRSSGADKQLDAYPLKDTPDSTVFSLHPEALLQAGI